VRPDPREIARHLDRFYPGYVSQEATDTPGAGPAPAPPPESLWDWLRFDKTRVAFVASAAAQGAMAVMMAITPLSLAHHGHSLAAISVSVALHVVGMYGFSLPVGRLSDRFGHRTTMLAGTAVCAVGAVLVPVSPDYWVATLGIFLVGLGWSFVTVSATAQIADVVPAQARGRAVGAGDTLAGAASIACPLLAGVVVGAYGLSLLAPVVLVLLAPAAVLLLRPARTGTLAVA
jgi:MFS family permease